MDRKREEGDEMERERRDRRDMREMRTTLDREREERDIWRGRKVGCRREQGERMGRGGSRPGGGKGCDEGRSEFFHFNFFVEYMYAKTYGCIRCFFFSAGGVRNSCHGNYLFIFAEDHSSKKIINKLELSCAKLSLASASYTWM